MTDTTDHPTLGAALSEATASAVAEVVEHTIGGEYGRDVAAALADARKRAIEGLTGDLGERYAAVAAGHATAGGLRAVAETSLRILVRDGLRARRCQCDGNTAGSTGPHPHPVGSLCDGHYDADTPPVEGRLLCGGCYCAQPEHVVAQIERRLFGTLPATVEELERALLAIEDPVQQARVAGMLTEAATRAMARRVRVSAVYRATRERGSYERVAARLGTTVRALRKLVSGRDTQDS